MFAILWLIQGGYTGVVPPVPIPNTEVKVAKADDSAVFCAKVGSPLELVTICQNTGNFLFSGILFIINK